MLVTLATLNIVLASWRRSVANAAQHACCLRSYQTAAGRRRGRAKRQGGFVDVVEFVARGGTGGSGAGGFELARGGGRGSPLGGDGGPGGSVVLVPDARCVTLQHLSGRPSFVGGRGRAGGRNGCTGRAGADVHVRVPLGCVVTDVSDYAPADNMWPAPEPTDQPLDPETWTSVRLDVSPMKVLPLPPQDLSHELILAPGGRGGRGNAHNKCPGATEIGQRGAVRRVRVELQTIADVGLVGAPNAGKSSLLAAITSARPAIAAYAFTTLRPHIGVVFPPGGSFRGPGDGSPIAQDASGCSNPQRHTIGMQNMGSTAEICGTSPVNDLPFTVADIPGLIEDAHEGRGLGHDFLRHVVRARTLALVVDAHAESPGKTVGMVLSELEAYREGLSSRVRLVVANKADRFGTVHALCMAVDEIREAVKSFAALTEVSVPVLPVSAKHSFEVARVVNALQRILADMRA